MNWLKIHWKLKICTTRPQGLGTAFAGEMMWSFWELQSTKTFSWQSSWWWKRPRILFPAAQWIHMSLDLAAAWWRNSRSVGWRSDYEGHQSKEATKEIKILFIGTVYKATWKAMKKKAFIPLLCLPTFLHLRMRPNFHQFWFAMRRRIRFFICCGNTSWTKIPI